MLIPELARYYEDHWEDAQTSDNGKAYVVIFPKLMKLEKMFADAGGTLIAGTDPTGYGGVVPGFSGKREIELLVEAGFTFPQALKIATLNGARFLGRDKEVGSLSGQARRYRGGRGRSGEERERASNTMPFVFKSGVGYDSDEIFDALKGQVGLY